MKGYFSSLIQQTGITFKPDGDSNSEVLESPPVRSEELNKTTPIHVVEEKVIEPQTDKSIGEIHEDVTESFKHPDSHTESKNIHHIEEKILIEHQTDKSAGETHEDIKVGLKHSELYAGGRSNQYLTEDFKGKPSEEAKMEGDKPQKGNKRDTLFTSRKLPTKCDKNYEKMFEKEGAAESVSQEYKKNLPPEHGINLNNQLTRKQILEATFKEVREWVAEKPDEDIGELHKSDTFKTPSLPDQRLLSMIPEQGRVEQQETEKPEIHDFHLSIGTISLTIESPQKGIQSYKPVQIRRDKRSIKENGFSRLSRHYIKI
ncbi:MAG: hypothetical protein AB1480_05130 [Nitrospirota bacterium]